MAWKSWKAPDPYPSQKQPERPSSSAIPERHGRDLIHQARLERSLERRERWATAMLAVLVSLTAFSAHLSTPARSAAPAQLCIQGPGVQMACAAPLVMLKRHGVLAAWFRNRVAEPPAAERAFDLDAHAARCRPMIQSAHRYTELQSWDDAVPFGSVRRVQWGCDVVGRTLAGAVLVQCGPQSLNGWRTFERF